MTLTEDVGLNLPDIYTSVERICRKGSRCRRRTCLTCERSRNQWFKTRVVERQTLEHLFLITLTKKVSDKPLFDQFRILQRDFRRLRSRQLWTRYVIGGAYAYHVVGDDQPDHWNPHLHLIASIVPPPDRPFWDLPWSNNWEDITKDSTIVHISKIENDSHQRWRVPNYIFRSAFEPFKENPDMMREFGLVAKGKRLFGILGAWRKDFVLGEEEIDIEGGTHDH
jgi:hypothetical protein